MRVYVRLLHGLLRVQSRSLRLRALPHAQLGVHRAAPTSPCPSRTAPTSAIAALRQIRTLPAYAKGIGQVGLLEALGD